MLALLTGFAALSLISGALTSLLPEGSLRHAASMAVGLLMLLYWATGLQGLLERLPGEISAPSGVLTGTGVSLEAAEAALHTEGAP